MTETRPDDPTAARDPQRSERLLRTEHDALLPILRRTPEEALGKPTACPGWSVRDVLAHCAAALTRAATGQLHAFTPELNEIDVAGRRDWPLSRLLSELERGYLDAGPVIADAGGRLDPLALGEWTHGGDVRDALGEPLGLLNVGYLGPARSWPGTPRAHRARADGRSRRIAPPRHRAYLRPALDLSDDLLVVCTDGEIAGYGELRFESWNDRAAIEHLYVSAHRRGQGVGRSLIDALAERAARRPSARCLWLETQNVNFPAVQFYLRMGFRLCGLDQTLYRAEPHILPGETALYFSRDL